MRPSILSTEPAPGVWLQTDPNSTVKTVSADANKVELRLERGKANVTLHHPAEHAQILVDLPGGQTSLLKDGLYTFNAETNTVRVLHGEAEVYPGTANANVKPVKVKEDHELTFAAAGAGPLKAREADPQEMMSDVLPAGPRPGAEGYGGGYGYGPYGDGYPYVYPYPYAAYWGYPWGYPYYAWGYPYVGFGFGFGYYGGFRGGRWR
jgi:hypothetical protein